ncbi:hypothetical protein EXIGLDRAFT_759652 [Exidia glandulosa HHB12029]|uniref:Conidiation protein 6 n=1 Tax=Exidia glandulosa HHB12029 TaxID=1314781 RepID=A0A165Q1B8_EXIGL|nr:hypothetical protein EXIGLDRAFT_759652 [Exidia glandulosa HHB12029]
MSAQQHEENVIRGHRAAIHNPRVSDEAKAHSEKVVEQYEKKHGMGPTVDHEEEVHEHRVVGGYKATLSNPRTSEAAKEHAREVLDEMGVDA